MTHSTNSALPPFWVIIPAAGVGRRFGAALPKQYLELAGQRVIDHVLSVFITHPQLRGCMVAIDPDDAYWAAGHYATHSQVHCTSGGAERCHSVLNALVALTQQCGANDDDWVLVHDAARPCLRRADVDNLLIALADEPVGALLAVPIHDTVKQSEPTTPRIVATIPRATLWRAYTPQAFRLGLLRHALQQSIAQQQLVTDDASAVELLGLAPQLIDSHADNIKITRPEDLPLAHFFLMQMGRVC